MSDAEIPRTATKEWKWKRAEVIIRDEYECQNPECDALGGPKGDSSLHVHHIVPVAEGGTDDDENLQTLCKPCHFGGYAHVDRFGGKSGEPTGETTNTEYGRSRDTGSGQYVTAYRDKDFLEAIGVIRAVDGAATTSKVMEHLDCSQRLALDRLHGLVDDGRVSVEKIGNAYVWSVVDE